MLNGKNKRIISYVFKQMQCSTASQLGRKKSLQTISLFSFITHDDDDDDADCKGF